MGEEEGNDLWSLSLTITVSLPCLENFLEHLVNTQGVNSPKDCVAFATDKLPQIRKKEILKTPVKGEMHP